MGQRIRAAVNVRLVVTSDADEPDLIVQAVQQYGAMLNAEVQEDVRGELASLLDYFDSTSTDLFEIDVQHAVVNVNQEVAA